MEPARYLRINPDDYLAKEPSKEPLRRLEEIDAAATQLLALTQMGWTETNPFYYYDMRWFYQSWKAACRDVFKSRMDLFQEQYDEFGELDAVTVTPLYADVPERQNKEGNELIKRIENEVLQRVRVLRAVKKALREDRRERKNIVQITVVSAPDRTTKTTFTVNGRDEQSFELSLKEAGSGKLLYDLAHSFDHKVETSDYTEQVLKYWNSNKGNPIYKVGGYQLTQIVEKVKDQYIARVQLKHVKLATQERKKRSGKHK